MPLAEPYYQDDTVTLFHGDCREVANWVGADVLVTDPPYGIGYQRGRWTQDRGRSGHDGIAGDADTTVRDAVLTLWGVDRPALVFGSMRAERYCEAAARRLAQAPLPLEVA